LPVINRKIREKVTKEVKADLQRKGLNYKEDNIQMIVAEEINRFNVSGKGKLFVESKRRSEEIQRINKAYSVIKGEGVEKDLGNTEE